MSKKAKKKRSSKDSGEVCATCANYRASGKNKGRCLRKDKKRAPNEKACSHHSRA